MARATLAEVIRNPLKIVKHLGGKGFFQWIPDKQYLEICYRAAVDLKLDLENPTTFSEKLQWLKLYDRKPIYTTMVDKYEAKKYVASIIGEEYIIPTYGVWDRFEDIDFDALPDQFVLKCTHDSGGVVICKDKSAFDIRAARKKIHKSLKRKFFYVGREWPYKDVKPRIIVEQYLEDVDSEELRDYKFYCFNGYPRFCQVISDRSANETIDFFDMQWYHQEFTGLAVYQYPNASEPIPMPSNIEAMKACAEKLSAQIPFLRVDFYCVNGKLYFGELTFYPASGFGLFSPDDWNYKLGKMLDLDEKTEA